MNQIAASLLILSASICGYAGTIQAPTNGGGNVMTLIGLGLGLWGVISLMVASTRFPSADLRVEDNARQRRHDRRGHSLPSSDLSPALILAPADRLTREPNVRSRSTIRSTPKDDVVDDILHRHVARSRRPRSYVA